MIIKRAYELRIKNHLSISDVSKALSITDEQAILLEQEDIFPHRNLLQKLADFYHVSYEYLIGKTDFTDKENIAICRNLKFYFSDNVSIKKFQDSGFSYLEITSDIMNESLKFTYESLNSIAEIIGTTTHALLCK